jgi:hypothetical protein
MKKMKKNRLLFGFAALFVAVAVIFSCQKDEIFVNDSVLSLKAADVSNKFVYDDPACINESHMFEVWIPSGNGTPDITIEVQYNKTGGWVELVKQKSVRNSSNTLYGTLTQLGEHNLRVIFQGPYDSGTIEVIECDCEYTMTAAVECDKFDRTTTFTYVAEEDGYLNLQGGLTNWVTNQSLTVWKGTEDVTSDFTLEEGVPVQKIRGEITACETYTFIINWEYVKIINDDRKDKNSGEHEVDEWTATLYDDNTMDVIISIMETPELIECGDDAEGELVDPEE